jgi:hypothetical protein
MDFGDGLRGGVSVHDLYLEFAKAEVEPGQDVGQTRYLWCDQRGDNVPRILEIKPSGNNWENVEKISVRTHHHLESQCGQCKSIPANQGTECFFENYFASPHEYDKWKQIVEKIEWKYFCNVVVLELSIKHTSILDLSALGGQLRSLKLKGRRRGESGVQLVKLVEMRNLGWLDLSGLDCATCFKDIGLLSQLQVLQIRTGCIESTWSRPLFFEQKKIREHSLELSEVAKCSLLRELVLECDCLKSFPNFAKMTSLRKVGIAQCSRPTELLGLGPHMAEMEELRLTSNDSLCQFPGVGGMNSLQVLEVEGYSLPVEEFPELNRLKKLRKLSIMGATRLLRLPQLAGLIALEEVRLEDLDELRAIPDMRGLEKLRKLIISSAPKLLRLPQLAGSIALEELSLWGLPKVRVLPDLRGLTMLRSIYLRHAPQLLQQPRLYDFVPQLPHLRLDVRGYGNCLNCGGSFGAESFPGSFDESESFDLSKNLLLSTIVSKISCVEERSSNDLDDTNEIDW